MGRVRMAGRPRVGRVGQAESSRLGGRAGRADLTDAQWVVLGPLLPVGIRPGRPPKWSKRQLINGIRWWIQAGAPWRDVSVCYGPWQTWKRILSVDSMISRAHQHAAGARKRGICRPNRRVEVEPDDHALGRSRGGFSTKTHLASE